MGIGLSTLVKANMAFFSVYGAQFLLTPDMVLNMNFENLKVTEFHRFLTRMTGTTLLGLCWAMNKLPEETALEGWCYIGTATTIIAPLYAQACTSLGWKTGMEKVKMPEHLLPVMLSLGFCAANWSTHLSK